MGLRALDAVLSCGIAIALAAAPAGAQPPTGRPAEVQRIRVESSADTAEVDVTVSAPVGLMVTRRSASELVFHLRGSVAGPDLEPLELGSGLVASVIPRGDEGSGSVEMAVRTRRPATYEVSSYEVSSEGRQLTVTLRAEPAGGPLGGAGGPSAGAGEVGAAEPPPPADRLRTDDVRIGSGDLLQIDVFGLDELDRRARVLGDGTISLPLLGRISVAGTTVAEAEKLIADLLADRQILHDPQVTLFVEELVSHTVSIQGAVHRPGVYPLAGRNTLLHLLGAAGGLSGQRGDRIIILRSDESGQEAERLEIDVWRLVEEGDASLNLPLQAGDIVMVPRERELRVYVTGAVRNPGPVSYSSSEGITVLQAITAAGGPTERANLKNVHVIRSPADGSEKRTEVNLKRIQAGKAEDVALERNDTVVVGEWFL